MGSAMRTGIRLPRYRYRGIIGHEGQENVVIADGRESSMRHIQIAVAAQKTYRMPADDMYLPIHVGNALHADVDLGDRFIPDNSGDNISSLNNYYSELTALYWI